MSEMLLASKSLLHVDINHRSLYSTYILEHNTKQCPNQQQWQHILSEVQVKIQNLSPRPSIYINDFTDIKKFQLLIP